MVTEKQIAAYVEALRRGDKAPGCDDPWQWERLRQQRLLGEDRRRVVEWYRHYEEETGTMLGCD